MKKPCEFNHDICNNIDKEGGARGGAGVFIYTNIGNKRYMLLGYEKYRNKYTLALGKRDAKETCYIQTAKRELWEEFKIILDNLSLYCVVNRTPIFIVKIDDIDITELNDKILEDNNNKDLDASYKEMDHVALFSNITKDIVGFVVDIINHVNKAIEKE